MKKKMLAVFLSALMIIGTIPGTTVEVFAAEGTEENIQVEDSEAAQLQAEAALTADEDSTAGPSWADQAVELTEGVAIDTTLYTDQTAYFKFTPQVDGTYYCSALEKAPCESGITIYEDNVCISYGSKAEMTVGHTYYLAVYCGYDIPAEGEPSYGPYSFPVSVIRKVLSASAAGDRNFTTDYNDSVTLEVSASTERDAQITYRWYEPVRTLSSGTQNTYTWEPGSYDSDDITIFCEVSDGVETIYLSYHITVTGMLTAEAVGAYDLSAFYDESTTMAVTASSQNSDLTYQWYQGNEDDGYDRIEGETASSLTIPAKGYYSYYSRYECIVSDGIMRKSVEFTVDVFSFRGLEITPVTAAIGDTVTLHCQAENCWTTDLVYQWYDEQGNLVQYFNSPDYTFTVTGENAVGYRCLVADGFRSEEVTADITYTDLSVCTLSGSCDSVSGKIGDQVTFTPAIQVSVPEDSSLTLSDLDLTYSWYQYAADENGNFVYQKLDGENGSTLTITIGKRTGLCLYRLIVSATDPEGKILAPLRMTCDLYAENGDLPFYVEEYLNCQAACWGDLMQIGVNCYGDGYEPDDFTYQWYRSESEETEMMDAFWEKIDGADWYYYEEVIGENSGRAYKCRICCDGWTAWYSFDNTASTLYVESDSLERAMKYGSSGTFRVNAKDMKSDAALTYQWYHQDTDGNWQLIDGASSATYKVPLADQTGSQAEYYCLVSNGSDERTVYAHAYFYGTVLTITSDEEPANDRDFTVRVESDGELSGYTWYLNGELLEGENAAECTIPKEKISACDDSFLVHCEASASDGKVSTADCTFWKETESTLTLGDSETWKEIPYGGSTVLKVNASTTTGNTITYQWKICDHETWDYRDIEGAVNAEYTVNSADLTESSGNYICQISDGVNTTSLSFSVQVKLLTSYSKNILVSAGEDITLSADLAEGCASDVSYQWSLYNAESWEYEDIEGANTDTLQIKAGAASTTTKYRCTVTGGTISETEDFQVTGRSTLAVTAPSTVTTSDSQATLVVHAVTTTGKTITYQWQQLVENPEGEMIYTDLAGETSAKLIVDTASLEDFSGCYQCLVSDGSSQMAKEIGLEYQPIEMDTEDLTYTALYENNLTLSVDAVAVNGQALTYQWREANGDQDYRILVGENSSTLTVDKSLYYAGPEQTYYFICEVSLGDYTVYTMRTINVTDFTVPEDTYVTVPYGGTQTLSVDAKGSGSFSYLWTQQLTSCAYPVDLGEEGSSLTVSSDNRKIGTEAVYICEVTNGSVTKYSTFHVTCISSITWEEAPSELYAGADTAFTLKSTASSLSGKAISYRWYRKDGTTGEMTVVSGADSDTFTGTASVNGAEETYVCQASDGDCTEERTFQVHVMDTPKTIEADTSYVQDLTKKAGVFYAFTAPTAGCWYLTSFDAVDVDDAAFYTKTENGYETYAHTYRCGSHGFQPEVILNKGQTIYFCLEGNPDKQREFSFVMSQNDQEWQKEVPDKILYVPYGETVTLSAPSVWVCEGNTYQWYISNQDYEDESAAALNDALIAGETGSSLSISAQTTGLTKAFVRCVLTQKNGEEYALNYQVVFSTIVLEDDSTTRVVSGLPGQTVDLSAAASSSAGNDLTFRWYAVEENEWGETEEVLISTDKTCPVTAPELGQYDQYFCRLEDGITTVNLTFYVFGGESSETEEIAAPSNIRTVNTADAITVKWNASEGAAAYRVFRRTLDSDWTKLGDTSSVSFSDTTVEEGTTYYYTVRCITSDGNAYTSDYDKTGSKIVRPAKPNVYLTNAQTGVSVHWTKSTGASAYVIYRKTAGGNFTKLATVSGSRTTWTDQSAVSGRTYYYKVCAKAGGFESSGVSDKKILYLKTPTVKVSKVTGGIQVRWNRSAGAKGYYVYRKTAGGSWTRIAMVTSTQYIDTTAKTGTKYYYMVKAYNGNTTSNFRSSAVIQK